MPSAAGKRHPEPKREYLLVQLQHGLRTPINAIIGYSRLLLEDGSSYACRLPDLQRIHSAGKRLLNLVDEVLDWDNLRDPQFDLRSPAFTHRVQHDLKDPLNVIVGYTEMLLEEADDTELDHLSEDLHNILTAAGQLRRTIDDLEALGTANGVTGQSQHLAAAAALAYDAVETLHSLTAQHDQEARAARVLVVDDNDSNRDLISRHLIRHGYRVETAQDGQQAVRMMQERSYDVVLLDVIMPHMNGYEALALIKSDEDLLHVPVIMISAYDDLESIARCIELGADEYLPKLFNPVLLRARVAACLEKKRLRDRERVFLRTIRSEQEKSEKLLLNILPEPIAQRLKQGESSIADEFAEVTVLFCDLVDFTGFGSRHDASTVVDRLNEVFRTFDDLVETNGLEKVKTIGDAYMLVGGLPIVRTDHAAAVADVAVAMTEAVERLNRTHRESIQARVGIHTGPVVAGVIGRTKFTYDLWGDTVNVASRMESHGIPGRIQVSECTYRRLREEFIFEKRGKISIKGKGRMKTYLLCGRR
ncbi:MAG: response regulator [Gammaproteobacteria bacterium]|nr:response regulator [Gammaproteobacteria bacterium]NIR84559.1 response regulator [Gammaproteobacteria bacterium]NIR90462.1 response regulator [Gammaproteobacteria bacterium]NIU05610.1 response regulator [Gammaproteobacteria bacterium]NIV52749.1 response regulator [Gammaproteobacteria bacterium]